MQHRRATAASLFQNGISRNTKCDIMAGFSHRCTYLNSLVLHAASLQDALFHKWTYFNSPVLHAAMLLVSICKLVISVKYIDKYSDICSLRHTNIRSLKTSIRCSLLYMIIKILLKLCLVDCAITFGDRSGI